MTVEDPIEYLHRDFNKSIINQREVSVVTPSRSRQAACAARCGQVIRTSSSRRRKCATSRPGAKRASSVAETGHLVFSTLHTIDATETINRIVAVFWRRISRSRSGCRSRVCSKPSSRSG